MATVASDAQGLDAPDSAGWWAFEGRYKTNPNDSTFRDVVEVVKKNGKFIFGSSLDWIALDEVIGKWYKLHMPWDTPPATLSPTLSPHFAPTCEECRSAIDGDPYVIKVWQSIGEKQYWHSRCFVLSHIALAHQRAGGGV